MPDPVALERALSVIRHAKRLGGKLSSYCVSVTREEGFELIHWFRDRATETDFDLSILDKDIEHAIGIDDPFFVLQHYELLGLKITQRLH